MSRSDDELILYFYGEHDAPETLLRELAADTELSRRYATLSGELKALDRLAAPEPRPGLESRMWARVAPELSRPSRRFVLPAGRLFWAASAATALLVALLGFWAGRTLPSAPSEHAVADTLKALPPAARERVLQAALSDHLDSSQRLLLEVANGNASIDDERVWAESLLSANRMYRRAAENGGHRRVAAVLAQLEPLLKEVADTPGSSDLQAAKRHIENEDLLFKVRIARNNLKELS